MLSAPEDDKEYGASGDIRQRGERAIKGGSGKAKER
jgi:hypothetical protein